jgi:hypothetical protein
MKSEYIACTAAVQEAIWRINSLLCLDVTKHAYETTVIYCDNTAAILFFSTNIIPWAVQRTDHDLLLGEGMYRDKMVREVGTNTFHSNPYRDMPRPFIPTFSQLLRLFHCCFHNQSLTAFLQFMCGWHLFSILQELTRRACLAFLSPSSSFCADTFDPLLSYTAPSAYYDRYPESGFLGRRGSSQTSTK